MKLSTVKQALLEKWLQGQAIDAVVTITQRPKNAQIPLSYPQERQLFLELLDPGTAVNNLQFLLEIKGRFQVGVLEHCVNHIIARHDVLRTYFSFGQGLPIPEIQKDLSIIIPIVDLNTFHTTEQITEARRLAEKDASQPFNLGQAPLMRLKLYNLNVERHFLLIVIHHTIADGWSLGVFLNELMTFYKNIISGTPIQLPTLPIQYADFAHWQTQEARSEALQSSQSYWKKQLGGELPVLELPTDRKRGSRQTFSGGTYHFVLSRDIIVALEKIGQQEDATLYMSLLAAFYMLLYRYSGQDEILVGTPTANRNLPELEHLIGVFINTLVIRIKLFDTSSFRELLKVVRDVTLEAFSHQDLPFEKLVEALKPTRDLSRHPLFQVVFNLQNSPVPKLEIPGLEIIPLEFDHRTSQFDLTLMISRWEEKYSCTVEYNSDLFNPETVKRMFRSFTILLEESIAQPDRPVSKLQFVPKEEICQLMETLNQTKYDFPRNKCVHQLFEDQVKKTPHALAVIHNNTRVSYSELNKRANEVANHLQSLGVGPEIRVGILMEKSVELLVALLSIHKAGGTYVPIHTSFPDERVQYILKDAGVRVLLTDVPTELGGESQVQMVCLHDLKVAPDNASSNLKNQVTSDKSAYIIYTSGSTGKPKGVVVKHSSLVNFLWSMKMKPGIREHDVLLTVTSISFDISALELFLPLVVGATVVFPDKESTTNPLLLCHAISQYKVNIMQATPATWKLLIESGWVGQPELKALCGGDVLFRNLADQLLDRVDTLWNLYGPTETTIWSSVGKIEKDDGPITIGQPIGNTQIYILDRHLQPLPIGIIGELHIGGEGLALGYLNLPHLTTEKFIPDPINSKPGARLYKTGDLACFLSDGSIELHGRIDDQVKIQGHRIELGEIESVILQHPFVQEAVAISRTELSGAKRLVAYFVPHDGPPVGPEELKDFVRKKLPAYMTPLAFIPLDCLPLTSNGKIDRKALPVPEDVRPLPGYAPPRTKEEEILASIWQNILEIEQVGIYDNFFDLGGASIQSLQMVAQANRAGFRLSPETIFEYQTIAELVENIKLNRVI